MLSLTLPGRVFFSKRARNSRRDVCEVVGVPGRGPARLRTGLSETVGSQDLACPRSKRRLIRSFQSRRTNDIQIKIAIKGISYDVLLVAHYCFKTSFVSNILETFIKCLIFFNVVDWGTGMGKLYDFMQSCLDNLLINMTNLIFYFMFVLCHH